MYIKSITSWRQGHRIVTEWGKHYNTWYGIEKHFMNDVLMQKRYIVANGTNKVFVKNRNLFGKFDKEV